ncbi:MAG: nucleotide exchange factor GrpE [Pseudomonadota bacterium]
MTEANEKPDAEPTGEADKDNDQKEDVMRLTDSDRAEGQTDENAGKTADDVAALNEQLLRMAAELENTRRRAAREKADAGKYAIANFARDLLGVADNFERAIAAADQTETGASGLIDGVRMTEKELLSTLERHGVIRISPAGEKFDPNMHQAVAQIPSETTPSGHVVDVAQSGFLIGERVLRAAMVTISTGPAQKPASDETSSGQDGPQLDVKL